MNTLRLAAGALLFASILPAGTIVNVSTNTTQVMNTGDQLFFLISNLSVGQPDAVAFELVTLPLDPGAEFTASLMSRDGSVSIDFSSVLETPGFFRGSLYSGRVTVISGVLHLPPTLSEDIFQNTRATLDLENIGDPLSVGLPGYRLPADMSVSLGQANISAGAITAGALYEDPPPPAPVPETGSGALVTGAGTLLCMLSRILKRISYRSIQ